MVAAPGRNQCDCYVLHGRCRGCDTPALRAKPQSEQAGGEAAFVTACQHGEPTNCRDCGMLAMGFKPAPAPRSCACACAELLRDVRYAVQFDASPELLARIDAALSGHAGEWELFGAYGPGSGSLWVEGYQLQPGEELRVYRRKAAEGAR